MYGMAEIVKDLVEAHRGATTSRDTRQVAWLLLLRLAADGVPEAWAALQEINRTARQRKNNFKRSSATLRDGFNFKRRGQGK
jgi:hypothetical protein